MMQSRCKHDEVNLACAEHMQFGQMTHGSCANSAHVLSQHKHMSPSIDIILQLLDMQASTIPLMLRPQTIAYVEHA